jgi:polyisoprenoid-binding protein YceI
VKRRPLSIGLAVAVAIAAVGGAAGLAYLFLRGAPPAAVSLDPGSSGPALGSLPSGATGTLAAGLDGTWAVDTSIGSFSDFSGSWVGYRVEETLAGNKANTAVGRTSNVSGTLVMSGTQISQVEITADLTALHSDDERRDGQLRNQALETSQFPEATFKLTAPIELGTAPADGQTLTAIATGELTLHGVTKAVEIPIQAKLSGDLVTVIGSIDIQFADYRIDQPVSFAVLSIEDHGTMELQLHFRHQ